jgi:hypothetical protein
MDVGGPRSAELEIVGSGVVEADAAHVQLDFEGDPAAGQIPDLGWLSTGMRVMSR